MASNTFLNSLPEILRKHIKSEEVEHTRDGFWLCTKSTRQLLHALGFKSIIDEDGEPLSADAYDDWHLTGVPCGSELLFSMIKIREPGDDQGRTGNAVPFVELNVKALADAVMAKDGATIYAELTRLTNPVSRDKSEPIRKYYASAESCASYLIADYTVRKVIKHIFAGCNRVWKLDHSFHENDKWAQKYLARLEELSIYDAKSNSITIGNPASLTLDEKNALLMMATGNASAHSYAAENLWHAMMLSSDNKTGIAKSALSMLGLSIDAHAVASDASVGSAKVEQVYEKFFKDTESDIYKQLKSIHKDWI